MLHDSDSIASVKPLLPKQAQIKSLASNVNLNDDLENVFDKATLLTSKRFSNSTKKQSIISSEES